MKIRIVVAIGLYTVAALFAGAHFLRAGNPVLLALCLTLPLLFLYRKRWILIVLQAMAYGMAVSWIVTILEIVQARNSEARPWATAALILGAVAAVTFVAGLLLNSGSVKKRYPR